MLWRTPSARFWRNLPAGFIQPCQPTLVANPPAGPGWLHEVKHDGFRILARKQGERVEVWSRRGALFNDRFPRIAEAVGALPVDNALIDGEAVVFLPDGHSDFAGLLTKAGGEQASFVAFDLLGLEGDDLRQRPLEERRDALARLVARRRRRPVQRSPGDRGRGRVRPRLQARPRGDRVEARRQPISERDEPQLAEVPEPGVSTPVKRNRLPHPLGAFPFDPVRIECERCGRAAGYRRARLSVWACGGPFGSGAGSPDPMEAPLST